MVTNNLHCIIITGSYGSPHRYYRSQDAALAAAVRHNKRTHEAIEVAWCKYRNNPKLWLAYVDADGTVRKTDSWHAIEGMELLRREFPNFELATLPPIPAGFTCTAWHNNALPTWDEGQSADEQARRLVIGIDYADKALRDDPDPAIKRFSLSIYMGDCSPEPILDTDDWSVLEAAVRLVGYIRNLDLGFHPDTRGRDYVMHSDGSRVFTDAEADDIDACVAAVSGACDVYEFGLTVWKAMGLDV